MSRDWIYESVTTSPGPKVHFKPRGHKAPVCGNAGEAPRTWQLERITCLWCIRWMFRHQKYRIELYRRGIVPRV